MQDHSITPRYEYELFALPAQYYHLASADPEDEIAHTTLPATREQRRELTDKWQAEGWEIVSHDVLLIGAQFVVTLLLRRPVQD